MNAYLPITERVIQLEAVLRGIQIGMQLRRRAAEVHRAEQMQSFEDSQVTVPPVPVPLSADKQPAGVPQPPQSAGRSPYGPPTRQEVATLTELFETHCGFVPPIALVSEGFVIADLLDRGLIARPASHLDGACYLIGSELRKAVYRV